MVAAQALGIARAALEYVTACANRREAFGAPITERAIQTMGGWGYISDHPVEKRYRDAKLYTIFEGTSEIQRIVISHALSAGDGAPPLHVDLEPSSGPMNRWFGRGTPVRTRIADTALSARHRVPAPAMRAAMNPFKPPGR